MPKKQEKPAKKVVVSSSEDDEEDFEDDSYDVEDSIGELDDDEGRGSNNREVNREHLLNYESDDSSDQLDSDDDGQDLDLAKGLSKQKQDLVLNDTWGGSKRNFYGRDKKRDDESDSDGDDEDEQLEALRLQKVRARKLAASQKIAAAMQVQEEEAVSSDEQREASSSDESEAEQVKGKRKKLGDKLFSNNASEVNTKAKHDGYQFTHLKDMLVEVKSKVLRNQVVDKEAPELRGLLEEFEISLNILTHQLAPLLAKIFEIRLTNKPLATFIELKHNLLLQYCTMLSFYLLLKVDKSKTADDVRGHPVLFKITTLKQTLDGLAPLDDKLEKALKKGGGKPKDDKSASEEDEKEEDADMETDDEEEGEDEEDDDEDMLDQDDGLLTKSEQWQLKEESKKGLAEKLKRLKRDDDAELTEIVKSSSLSKKEALAKKEAKLQAKELAEKAKKDAKRAQEQAEYQAKKQAEEDALEAERQQRKRENKLVKKEKAKEERDELDKQIDKQNESIARNVNYTILKSKGLTRKRKKIDRNSRVKFRAKYEKALQKRKSRVQEFQEGPRGKYGGESSGLKVGLIKSTHLS